MILCLPRSTLFPYTTLFRSDVEGRKLSLSHKQTTENPWDAHEKTYGIGTIHNGTIAELNDKGATIKDRKSTRLNSSHVRISYAVFSLKKKKKQADDNSHTAT